MRLEAVKPSRLSRYLQAAGRRAGRCEWQLVWDCRQAGAGWANREQARQRGQLAAAQPRSSISCGAARALVVGVITVAGRGANHARGAPRILVDADIQQLWVLLRQQGKALAGAGVAWVWGEGAVEPVGVAPGGAPAEVGSSARGRSRGKQGRQGVGWHLVRGAGSAAGSGP